MKTITINEWYRFSDKERYSFTGIIKRDNDNAIEYIENGLTHRLDGPAITWLSGEEGYWIHGKPLTKEDYNKHPEVIKNSKEFKNFLQYKKLI